MERIDLAVVGGGILGLATARALLQRSPGLELTLLEGESSLAAHQSGHNSGVIHSGLYYLPGSLKARLAVEGRGAMLDFCAAEGIPHELCGKVVVAVSKDEQPRLQELYRRGQANGVPGLSLIGPERLAELEPHARGLAALHVPSAGIVDYRCVAERLGLRLREAGAEIRLGWPVRGLQRQGRRWLIRGPRGELAARFLVVCAGLWSDRMARLAGLQPRLRILPFRGEYRRLRAGREQFCRGLIYPVPDPSLPFLGVHLTRRIDGSVEAGPNAVPAFSRRGYRPGDFAWRDALDAALYPGLWRLAWHHWRAGLAEKARAASPALFLQSARRLVPELAPGDLSCGGAGVRAQALSPQGELIQDFFILEAPGALHVLNAPSPAATASLSIGSALADRAATSFRLVNR